MKTHKEQGTFYAVEMQVPHDTEPTLALKEDGTPALFTAKGRAQDQEDYERLAMPNYTFRAVPVEVTFRWEAKP